MYVFPKKIVLTYCIHTRMYILKEDVHDILYTYTYVNSHKNVPDISVYCLVRMLGILSANIHMFYVCIDMYVLPKKNVHDRLDRI